MSRFSRFTEEYDIKKIALTLGAFVIITLGSIAGIQVLRNNLDIREQAAGPSCPSGTGLLTCSFDVESSGQTFEYKVVFSVFDEDGNLIMQIPSDPKIINDSERIHHVVESKQVPINFKYKCDVEVTYKKVCTPDTGIIRQSTEISCPVENPPTSTPATNPTLTPSPTPFRRTGVECSKCSQLQVTVDLTTIPPPPKFPPNIDEPGLKIGRVKLASSSADCPGGINCDNIDLKWVAFAGPSCGNVNDDTSIVIPTPPDRLDISCAEATGPDGAVFRLHQAVEDGCRCYQLRLDINGENDPPVCPNPEELRVCCPLRCAPPQIIDDPNNPDDQMVHLTNNAIQKFSDNYGCFEDGNQMSYQ